MSLKLLSGASEPLLPLEEVGVLRVFPAGPRAAATPRRAGERVSQWREPGASQASSSSPTSPVAVASVGVARVLKAKWQLASRAPILP